MYLTLCSEIQKETPLFILQYISNTPRPIQIKLTTAVALKSQIKDTNI